MPSKSKSQHNLMEAAAHGARWAARKVPPSVAKEFVAADKDKGLYRSKVRGSENG